MGIYSFFRDLYSLDTLDTRFTTSAKTPSKIASEESAKKTASEGKDVKDLPQGASPPKWYTLEFYIYALVFIICVPQMYKAVWDVSQPSSPNYGKYEHLLSNGWLFGRKVDNSDQQYAGFRENVPLLLILVVLHPLLRRAFERFLMPSHASTQRSPSEARQVSPLTRRQWRIGFDFASSIVFIVALHGFSALKILIILCINYSIAMRLPRDYIPGATWIFNIAILFANELSHGYSFATLAGYLMPFYAPAGAWGKYMDSYGGIMPRWEVFFNLTVLRLISFNMDYYWSLDRSRSASPVEVRASKSSKQLDPASLSERDRVTIPASSETFTAFTPYVAYALYPPLYIAGPILTFNDYISQSTYRSASLTTRRTTLYAIRFLLTLLFMEFLLHTIYPLAISKSHPDWSTYTPFQLSMLAYFNLHLIWLKLLLPWRFFRLWSLVDSIDPPENVVRCMSDNYSTLAFWRGWHRSFNRWIVRYIYIPLGGGQASKVRTVGNMLAVFTFVALWHDINPNLLIWGWLVIFFVLPEVLATMAFPARKWQGRPTTYRVICGIGAVGNVLMMMSANLVGFAIGLDGLKGLVRGLAGTWEGLVYVLVACGALFVGVQVMFEHREEEKRKGIKMAC